MGGTRSLYIDRSSLAVDDIGKEVYHIPCTGKNASVGDYICLSIYTRGCDHSLRMASSFLTTNYATRFHGPIASSEIQKI